MNIFFLPIKKLSVVLIVVFLFVFCVSCKKSSSSFSDDTKGMESILHQETDQGAEYRIVIPHEKQLSLKDEFVVAMTVILPEGLEAGGPQWEENAFENNRLDVSEITDETFSVESDGTLKHSMFMKCDAQWAEERPSEDGMLNYRFPETWVKVTRKNQKNADDKAVPEKNDGFKLVIEAFDLKIASVTDEEWTSMTINDEMRLFSHLDPKEFRRRVMMGGGIGLLVAILIAIIVWKYVCYRRRLAALPPPPIPPEVRARTELENLLAEKLTEQGEYDKFYTRISGVMRTYIEEKFQVKAPEQTTQEFLAVLSANPHLLQDHRGLLKSFLQHCDMVKFAKMSPEQDEVSATVDKCVKFIDATAMEVQPSSEQSNQEQKK